MTTKKDPLDPTAIAQGGSARFFNLVGQAITPDIRRANMAMSTKLAEELAKRGDNLADFRERVSRRPWDFPLKSK